ncbi:MAG: type II secretion system F family protein [Nanopusillaceae archaeon]|jgi:archaellum biogenesis protein FlaJ (TadC family)
MPANIYETNKENIQKNIFLTKIITQLSNVSDPLHYKQVYLFGKYIKEEKLVLILSIILSSIIGIFGIIFKLYLNYISLSILILAVYMIGGLPYLFYKYIEDKINESILDNYPYFLSYLSESLASGMTLLDALNYVSSTDLGYLNIFIRKLYSWIKWGMPFEKSFSLFNKYFEDLLSIKMINYVILETYIGGGDISKVLKRLYEDLEGTRELEKLKRSYVSQQIMVLYTIYIIFIGLSIAILDTLQPLINSQLMAASLHSSFNFFSYSINYGWLKFITSISILFVGVSTAIIMGIAESSKIRSSVKHLAANSFIGLLSIIIFILPVSVNFTLNVYPQTAYVYSPVNIQIYASVDAQPLSNIPITIMIVGNNYYKQFFENLQNGYYSMSITFNNTGEYIISAVMKYEGRIYTQKQQINVTI